MKRLILFLPFIYFFVSCSKTEIPKTLFQISDKTYLALGDSYTFGEAVPQEDSFPYQLVNQLNSAGIKTLKPEVVAETGWTSKNLIDGISQSNLKPKYDIVTLLIGSNNQYLKYSKESYRKELTYLINTAVSHSVGGRATVFVFSLPDWGVTPFGQLKNPAEVSIEIDAYNKIIEEETFNARVHYVNITPESRFAGLDQTLTSQDELHPSGKMYAGWVKKLFPLVKSELY